MTTTHPFPTPDIIRDIESLQQQLHAALTALRAHEQWEVDIIMSDDVWKDHLGRPDVLPHLTQKIWDDLLKVQDCRNRAFEICKQSVYLTKTKDDG